MQNFAFQCQRSCERFTLTLTLDLRFEFNVADGNFYSIREIHKQMYMYVQRYSIYLNIYLPYYIYLHLLFSSRIVSFIFELRWVCKNSHKIFNFHFYVRSKKTREKSNKNTYPYSYTPVHTPIHTHTLIENERIFKTKHKFSLVASCGCSLGAWLVAGKKEESESGTRAGDASREGGGKGERGNGTAWLL